MIKLKRVVRQLNCNKLHLVCVFVFLFFGCLPTPINTRNIDVLETSGGDHEEFVPDFFNPGSFDDGYTPTLSLDSLEGVSGTVGFDLSGLGSGTYSVRVFSDSNCRILVGHYAPVGGVVSKSFKNLAVGRNDFYFMTTGFGGSSACRSFATSYLGRPTAPISLSVAVRGTDGTPEVTVWGGEHGDRVELYGDNICSILLGSAVMSGSSVGVTSESLSEGVNSFYAKRERNGVASDCSTAHATYELQSPSTPVTRVVGTALPTTPLSSPFSNVCNRTAIVQSVIVAKVAKMSCSEVTENDLRSISSLALTSKGLTSLQEGDFAGLSSLRNLYLDDNQLSSLPPGVFAGLSSLTLLSLNQNQLSALPLGIFSGRSELLSLFLARNQLSTLPPGVFAGLSSLTSLGLSQNQLSTLPPGVFAELSSLLILSLGQNQLSTLPPEVFARLSSLTLLSLDRNQLGALQTGIFSGVPELIWLHLDRNQLSTLPTGVFAGLYKLSFLNIENNQLSVSNYSEILKEVGHEATARNYGTLIAGNLRYNASVAVARQALIDRYWTIADGGLDTGNIAPAPSPSSSPSPSISPFAISCVFFRCLR